MENSAGPTFPGDVHRSQILAPLMGEPIFRSSSPFSILESPCCEAGWNSGEVSCLSNCPLLLHISKAFGSSSSPQLCLETKANWGIKSSAPTFGVNGGDFCHSQALYLQNGLKLVPGMPGLGNQQRLLGVQGRVSHPGNGRSPNSGITETQVTYEIASKFCHLSEPLYCICKR